MATDPNKIYGPLTPEKQYSYPIGPQKPPIEVDTSQETQSPQVSLASAPITSNTLRQPTPTDFNPPEPTPSYPVASLSTEIPQQQTPQLTAPQTEVQRRINEITGMREEVTDEATFRAQQEQAQGLPELYKAQNELAARLKTLQNEAQAIPLQLQQESIGRGRTAGGLQSIQSAALRNNAIQALATSSLLEASKGNIMLAQNLADRAVAQKYDPIKRSIEAKMANLDLIIKSPEYTEAEKQRAEAQKSKQAAEARAIEKQETQAKEISNTLNLAVKYGLKDTQIMDRIGKARTPLEALQLAAPYLQDPKAKYELEEARLNNILKGEQIATERIQRQKIVNEMASNFSGITDTTQANLKNIIKSNKIGQGTKTQLGTILGVLGAIEGLAEKRPEGKFTGFYPGRGIVDWIAPEFLKRNETITNETYLEGVNLKIQQWASGAALTEAQTEQVKRMTPKKNDTDRQVRQKLNQLSDFMQQQIKGSLLSEGVDYKPTSTDLFNEKMSKEDNLLLNEFYTGGAPELSTGDDDFYIQ